MTSEADEAAAGVWPKRGPLWHSARALFVGGLARLADIVVPPVCTACQTPLGSHDTLCPDCWRQIDFIRPPLCDRLGLPLPYDSGAGTLSALAIAEPPLYRRARAVARYDGIMRDLIHDMKFRDRHDGRVLLGRWLVEAGGELIASADVLIPVPLHRFKLLQRRFNQAALLTAELARLTGKPHAPLALVRTRRTARQLGLTRDERKLNVRNAFKVPAGLRARIAGRTVLLVDDVITTGATITAATRALQSAGAAHVDVLALALVTDITGTLQA